MVDVITAVTKKAAAAMAKKEKGVMPRKGPITRRKGMMPRKQRQQRPGKQQQQWVRRKRKLGRNLIIIIGGMVQVHLLPSLNLDR